MKVKLLITAVLSLVIYPAYANYNPYISITGGASRTKIGKAQTISLSSTAFDTKYTANSGYITSPYFGVAAGIFVPTEKDFNLQLGIGVYETYIGKAKGAVYKNPNFPTPNEFYQYKLHSTAIVAEAQISKPIGLNHAPQKTFLPYLKLGVGTAINYAYNYQETPATATDVATPPFTSRITMSPAIQIGAGVAMKIKQNWTAGIGYQYSYLGTAKLGLSPAQSTTNQLKTKRLTTNSLLFNLTYMFD